MNQKVVVCGLLLSLSVTSGAAADSLRQHAPHVHGEATGNLSQDGSDLRLELEIPGMNLVGFEHAPRTEAQQTLLDDTLTLLNRGDWLVLDPRGACRLTRINAHTHGFDAEGSDHSEHDHGHHHHHDHGSHDHAHHGHDDGHGHERDHDHGHHHDHEHAEFHIVARIHCEAAENLRWMELGLFADFPGNERIVLNVLTERQTTQARLQPGRIRVEL